jgi:uncharacterized protein DUF4238
MLSLTAHALGEPERQVLETDFTKIIDTAAARVRAEIIGKGQRRLTTTQRVDWARLLNSLRGRQPEFVESKVKAFGAEVLRQELENDSKEYEAASCLGDPPTLLQWVDRNLSGELNDFGLRVWPDAIDDERLIEKVVNLHCGVCDFAKAKHELLLSDNPLVSIGDAGSPTWLLALPLSPTKLFVGYRADKTVQFLRSMPLNEIVIRMNESSIIQAVKWVYARLVPIPNEGASTTLSAHDAANGARFLRRADDCRGRRRRPEASAGARSKVDGSKLKAPAPVRPQLVISNELTNSVPKALMEMLRPAQGGRVEIGDAYREYATRCEAAGTKPAVVQKFAAKAKKFCEETGIATKAIKGRAYLIDVQLVPSMSNIFGNVSKIDLLLADHNRMR